MMLRPLQMMFASVAFATTLSAQIVLQDEITRVQTAWPASAQGVVADLAAGAFRLGHPGRSAVMLRNGALELCYQPAVLHHWVAAGGSGLTRIAALPSGAQGRRDRLVAMSAQGLHLMSLGSSGFATIGGGPFANWIGVADVKAYLFPIQGTDTPLILGIASTGVRVATLGATDNIVPVAEVPVPSTMQVLDAVLVDWVAGGWPEILALTTVGTFVVDLATLSIAAQLTSITTSAGFLAQLPDGAFVVQLTQAGSDWRVVTLLPGQTYDTEPVFSLAKPPTGLVTGRWNEDDFPDVIISTGELVRHVLTGDAEGPRSALAYRLQITDYAGTPPGNPVDNVAPAIVDDIDYDGEKDLLAINQTGGKLVVTRELRRQIVANDPGSQIPVTTDAQTGVVVEDVYGFDWLFPNGGTNVPSTWTSGFNHMNEDALAVSCRLPSSWATSHQILVTTYPIVINGGTGGDDTVDLGGGMTLTYALAVTTPIPNPNTPAFADLVVLFDATLSSFSGSDPIPVWSGQERFLVEYVLCKSNTQSGFEWVGEPQFTMFGAKHSPGQTPLQLENLLQENEQIAEIGESWWVEESPTFDYLSAWLNPSSQERPGEANRWVGWNPVIRRKEGAPSLPATVQTATMGNARVH